MSEAKQELQTAEPREITQANDAGTIMSVISRAASDPNTDVDKLERLMGMYERIEARQAEVAYHEALTELQANLPEITERSEIKHGKQVISTYAKWEDINKAIKPILREYGFSLSFRVDTEDKVRVEGVLSHQKGHSERTAITLPSDTGGAKNAVQAVASSVSYGKRYVASALLNITTHGEDDDGQAAGAPGKPADPIDAKTASRITDLIEVTGSNESNFLRWVFAGRPPQGATVSDIPASMGDKAIQKLEAKYKQTRGEE